ncbi:MAG: zinc ribbon domain-containing protein [Eubacteriales bacterium]
MFCRNCGYKLKDDARFCINCGMKVNTKIDATPAQSPPVQMRPGTQQQSTLQQAAQTVPVMAANTAAGTAPVTAGVIPQAKPKKKKKTALIVVLCLSALLVAGLVFGGIYVLKGLQDGSLNLTGDAAGSTKKSTGATLKDSVLSFDGVTLDYGDNTVPKDAKEALTIADLGDKEPPDGLASTLYDLRIDPAYTEPVTISIPFTEDLSDLDNTAVPMLGIGTVVTYEDGTQSTRYQYLETEVKDKTATATFVPSEVIGITVTGATRGAAASVVSYTASSTTAGAKPSLESVSAGIIWCSTTFKNGGNFVVYFPAQAHKFFIDYNDREAFLTDLEWVRQYYVDKGYTFDKRTAGPMCVYVTRGLEDEADYESHWYSNGANGYISIRSEFFEGGYQSAKAKPLMIHEYFHYVQLNYVTKDTTNAWFDDATTCYFEYQVSTVIPDVTKAYETRMFEGVFPAENTARNGYGRMYLISYLAKTLGSDDFIRQAYIAAGSGTDWETAITDATGEPSDWYEDFYVQLVKGTTGGFNPSLLYSNLVKGEEAFAPAGTKLDLIAPLEDEITAAAENSEPVELGSTNVSVAAYGAQLVALTMSADNVKLMADGVDPTVSVSDDAALAVYYTKGSTVVELTPADGKVTLTDFKKNCTAGGGYLVLVIGASDAQSYTVTVELEPFPTLDELVGRYEDGTVTIDTVFISDALRQQMTDAAAAQDQATADAENPLAGVGCDINMIEALEAMEGQAQPSIIVIEKTGEDTGTLTMNTAATADQPEQAGTPMPFVYKAGTLTLDFNVEGSIGKGALDARYGPSQTVTLKGSMRSTIESIPESDLYFDISIAGTKPIEVP